MLTLHREYRNLMAGAHRRRVTPLHAPAVVRHIAFWNPIKWPGTGAERAQADTDGEAKPESGSGHAARREARNRKLDRVISAVYRSLKFPDQPNHVTDPTVSGATKQSTAQVATLFAGVMDVQSGRLVANVFKLRPDKYRAVKISFFWYSAWVTLSFENHTEYVTCTATLDFSGPRLKGETDPEQLSQTAYHRLHAALTKLAESPEIAATDCGSVYSLVYREIWALFDEDVLDPLLRRQKGELGPAFADFRGLFLRAMPPSEPGAAGGDGGLDCSIAKPFMPPFRDCREEDTFNPERKSNCRMRSVRQIWPLLKSELGDDVEFTVSQFLKGRAVYATALGEQRSPDQPVPDPLHYFFYEDTINKWQLGRLCERMNTLGTLRLASLMHFEKMRAMEGELQAVERRIAKALSFARNTSPDNLKSAQSIIVSLWGDYSKLQNALSPYRTMHPDDPLNGGLEYRADRSRYYQSQFFGSLDTLRIKRVEGFQPYNEFVRRRLRGAFDFIDRLGGQFGRMQADLVTLFQYSQTLRSLEMEIDIRARNEEIASTQRAADLILFGVLLPYYGSGIIAETMKLSDVREQWQSLVYFVAIAIGLHQFASRNWELGKDGKGGRSLALGLALLTTAFIAWVQTWIGPTAAYQWVGDLVQSHIGSPWQTAAPPQSSLPAR